MKNIHVRRILMTVMVTGALVGCGSQDTNTTTQDVTVSETTTEYGTDNASVEETTGAATVEESVESATEETVVEEVEPQTETRKVLAGSIRKVDGEYTDVMSYIYDENGEVVKAIYNSYEDEELAEILSKEDLSAEDFMNFGEKYVEEYIVVTKSENGRLLECDWYYADGTSENDHVVYTYNEAGSELTKDEYGADWETHGVYHRIHYLCIGKYSRLLYLQMARQG